MKINYFNADHTHALIDLPTRYSIEEVIKLLKGGSSYWINHSRLIKGRFAWALATEHFQFRIRMLVAWLGILPIRRNIIAGGLMRRSTRCYCELKETIKMVAVRLWRFGPQPKGWGE
jgi:Transposase IS200 like